MPNLASRAMGLALRKLPEQWQEKHGYRPLLAETFTDIESFEGTCYKASNWEPCGLTKGFERSHRADFYREHKRPKKLWLKTLSRNTRVILTGIDIPAAYQPGCDPQTLKTTVIISSNSKGTNPPRSAPPNASPGSAPPFCLRDERSGSRSDRTPQNQGVPHRTHRLRTAACAHSRGRRQANLVHQPRSQQRMRGDGEPLREQSGGAGSHALRPVGARSLGRL